MTKNDSSSHSVKIVGNKLILSLPNAKMPVVWQSDLTHAQSLSFSVKEDKKSKSFILISKNSDSEIEEIAIFDDKQIAVDLLMEISCALQNLPNLNTANSDNNNNNIANLSSDISVSQQLLGPNNNQKFVKNNDNKIGAAIALLLIIVLISIWFLSASNNLNTVSDNNSNGISSRMADSSNISGVAISADDFLSNR